MKKDYSEYKRTEYDKYLSRRSNRDGVLLDYFANYVRFNYETKTVNIAVDDRNEYQAMDFVIEEYEQEVAERTGKEYKKHEPSPEEQKSELKETQLDYDRIKNRYNFQLGSDAGILCDETGVIENPLINIFSGAYVTLKYGEGILDFIYADFMTPFKKAYESAQLEKMLIEYAKELYKDKTPQPEKAEEPHKIYNENQIYVENFYSYEMTFYEIKDIAFASLYTAICPPNFTDRSYDKIKKLKWYLSYLLWLQDEYKEMIEFCYDEDFYPEILGSLYPSERLKLYRTIHDLPFRFDRTEELSISNRMGGKEMPYGMPINEILDRIKAMSGEPTEAEKQFAEKYNISVGTLKACIAHPSFMSITYSFRSVADILELEFTKMLEQNVHFCKCKRCGKYFIMKGKYDTRYCDRVAEGESRSCQEFAAAENYKAKHADDKATAIYSKYYKRYSARVKVRQIKEADFKKWKYQAMTKRDECTAGIISPEEFTSWMEDSFPNRKKKN
ncbi:MAG: hypothetical protein IIW88_07195 [Clostridia bacterium]|nr:hypothetical protein [Clostridia bacterium]